MYKRFLGFCSLAFILLFPSVLWTEKCKDFLLFDGSETLVNYGIDTTGNWWILSQPYTNEYRYIINGMRSNTYKSVSQIVFSPDGEKWLFFGKDNTNWNLVLPDTTISCVAQEIVDYGFSPNSQNYYYAIRNGNQTTVYYNHKTDDIINFSGKIYPNRSGNKIAFVLQRGELEHLVVDGIETEAFDEIKPLGFWSDDSFVFAGRRGYLWEIYRGSEPIAEQFSQLIDMKINLEGTVAAFLIRNTAGNAYAILYSDEFNEPVYSKPYDAASNLALHPTEALIGFSATKNLANYVVYGGMEYPLGEFSAIPKFTFDGSEIYYLYCNIECYLYVDGKRFTLPLNLSPENIIARIPHTSTVAYSNSNSMVMFNYDNNIQYSGMMVDSIIAPIYNSRTGEYQTLGSIGNKLYLLTCKP
jgi:hypothetical protein